VQADIVNAEKFAPIVSQLAKLISEAGIVVKPEVGRMGANTNNHDIKILVGQKPR
jgi:hypothetical protein